MSASELTDLAREAMVLILVVASPLLLAALVVGLVVGVLQALTGVQDLTLSFVPKILIVLAALLIFGPWMLQRMVEFGRHAFGP